ncbi:MAG: nickel pincer cofactor biosynthesis protein LarC [Actinomycetota bacterium]|nr:nickel pincer cofactor biosynthesis protein LarC [Actinomycetota bacterium]
MKIAYFDCPSGISGDMILGALVDAGLEPADLTSALSSLKVEDFDLQFQEVSSYGLRATQARVIAPQKTLARTFKNITSIIEGSPLPLPVKAKSLEIFMRIARAESIVHGKPIDQVHFHEVGELDSIVDIVGASYGIHALGIQAVYSSPLPLGHGMAKTQHGSIPIPAPAVLEILEDAPTYGKGIPTEIVTPTGASFIKSYATSFGNAPLMKISKVGCGAGTKDIGIPNILRIVIGEAMGFEAGAEEPALHVSANIDDMNPEFYEYVMERLFEAGAQDVWLAPIQMKKTRPAVSINVLCSYSQVEEVKRILLQETSTFGLRTMLVSKRAIERYVLPIETPWGEVKTNVGKEGGQVTNVSPEFSDCAKIARESGIPLKEVFREVQSLAFEKLGEKEGKNG